MILLTLHLTHIKCLIIQYFQSNFEHQDGSQFDLNAYTYNIAQNIVLKESNVYNRTSRCPN